MTVADSDKIVAAVRSIVSEVTPEALEQPKYGGVVYAVDAEHQNELFCGVFVRKDYVTLELNAVAGLNDPNGFLEGEGKTRKHLKLMSLDDLKTKHVRDFIGQSFHTRVR